jgi:hypothetical protein
MKKFSWILVLLIIIGLGALVWSQRDTTSTTSTKVEDVTVEGVGTPEGKKPFSGVDSLSALLEQGKSLECQMRFEQTQEKDVIEGTFFTDKGKLRGDFLVPAPEFGGTITSSMIVDGDTLYVWSAINGDLLGFTTSLKDRDTNVTTKEPVPLDTSVKYTCTEWTEVDGSVFVPPTQVKFVDTKDAVKAGMEYGTVPN